MASYYVPPLDISRVSGHKLITDFPNEQATVRSGSGSDYRSR
jgi:hypothetical protein